MKPLQTLWRSAMRTGLAVIMLIGLPQMVGAHALLTRSNPQGGQVLAEAPVRVTAWFSQELETRLSSLRVFDAEGRQVDEGDGRVDLNDPDHASMKVSLPAGLPPGTYTVRWTVVSAEDGDPTEGEFSFGVGDVPVAGAEPSAPALGGWLVGGAAIAMSRLTVVGTVWRQRRDREQ